MKVLVSVLPTIEKQSVPGVSSQVARLDRFTNGLLTRAIHHGLFETRNRGKKALKIEPWCYLRPRFQSCSAVMLWTGNSTVDWDSLLKIHPSADFLLDSESFSEADLKKVEKAAGENRVRLWPKKGDID
jgi:hypothetical protein